jgi:Tfp pilus assembly protein PilF
MRFFRLSAILSAFALLVCSSNLVEGAIDQSISGRLLFEGGEVRCEQQCRVTLLASGLRPVQTVFADLGGRFVFYNVPRGFYTIRVEIDGIDPVTQVLQGSDTSEVTVIVPLGRRTKVVSNGTNVVDVSEFLERYPKKAVSYFEKGIEALRKKKNDEAVKYFRNAVEFAPTFYEAHNQLGVAYREIGRLDDAEQEFLKAHELNSTSVDPLLSLTALYLDENETDRAVTTGEQAVKANSRSAPAFFTLGLALYKAAQLDRAETAFKRALDLAPKMGAVRLMLANVYLKLRRYDSTLEQLDRYIAENPKGNQVQNAIQMRDEILQAKAVERP